MKRSNVGIAKQSGIVGLVLAGGAIFALACSSELVDDVSNDHAALVLTCGGSGTSSISAPGTGTHTTGFEAPTQAECATYKCPTFDTDAFSKASDDAVTACLKQSETHTCPAGCTLDVQPASKCANGDTLSIGSDGCICHSYGTDVKETMQQSPCALNAQGRWQTTCTYTATATATGTFQVSCSGSGTGSGSATGSGTSTGSGTGSGSGR